MDLSDDDDGSGSDYDNDCPAADANIDEQSLKIKVHDVQI